MPRKTKTPTTTSRRKTTAKTPAKTTATTKAQAKPTVKPRKAAARSTPILRTADIQEIVRDLGWRVAQRDVEQLMSGEETLREQARALTEPQYALLREQVPLALDILRDHVDGEIPQIPLSTIAVLAAAISYYDRDIDVIPDFLPHIGRLDDAAVMAMAFQLAEAGIRRYCDWKGLPLPTFHHPLLR